MKRRLSVTMPEKLVGEIDRAIGNRSKFLEAGAVLKLHREAKTADERAKIRVIADRLNVILPYHGDDPIDWPWS